MLLTRQMTRRVITGTIVAGMVLTAVLPAKPMFARGTNTVGQVAARSRHPCLVITGSGDSTFTRNFNPFGFANDRVLDNGAIYQTLFVFTTAGGGHRYPMLATKYSFSRDARTLTITLRKGMKWSDGKSFTSKDVIFTLWTGPHRNKAYDQLGVTAPDSSISSIKAVGPDGVVVLFSKSDVIAAEALLSTPSIIPEHIWSSVPDPSRFTNPNPVGTGPFTQVKRFNQVDYVLGKNPHFWMKGKPAVPCIDRVYSSGNESTQLMLIKGDVDWADVFIPSVQKVYVSHDPAHYHYFYATTSDPVGLFYDDTKYPWSLVSLRKAVSMAMDRVTISKVGENGYAPPADALGIKREYPKWVDPTAGRMGASLVKYNPAAARALLTTSGFKYDGSTLIDPKGNPVHFELDVIAGWTDWVLSLRILQKNLKAIGITTTLNVSPTFGAWEARADRTQVMHFHGPCGGGFSPYTILFNHLSTRARDQAPVGEVPISGCDWERFADPRSDALFRQWRSTPRMSGQKKIAAKLERMFIRDFPYIPVFVGPLWDVYSTKYFTNFPDKNNYYALGPSYVYPDNGLVLSTVEPVR